MIILFSTFIISGCSNSKVIIEDKNMTKVKSNSIEELELEFLATKKLAEQGDLISQYNLGYMYRNGEGVTYDYAKAAEWYKKAADRGHRKAQYNLGMMYYQGKYITQDYEKAFDLLQKATNQEDYNAQTTLGVMYAHGLGIFEDDVKSKEWFKKACDNGDKISCKFYKDVD